MTRAAASSAAMPHNQSHRGLLRRAPVGRSRSVDALFVPASRPASHLRVSAGIALSLDCELVVLCSRDAKPVEFAQIASEWPALRWAAIDIPAGYRHPTLEFSTSTIDEAKALRLGDLSLKRNIGLLFARMLGWRSILFLDDDVFALDPGLVRQASAASGRVSAVGFPVHEFPDNSVVCHANRLAGGQQDVFVSGSALLVRPGRRSTFFPEIYNEDWFFMFDDLSRGAVASMGQAHQLPYAPFADPDRAAEEEFGDLLAEGLMGLIHARVPVAAALEDQYWREFLLHRREFIERSAERLAGAKPATEQFAALSALRTAEARRAAIAPAACSAYLRTWRADQARWAQRVDALTRMSNFEAAAQFLELSDRLIAPDANRRRKVVQMSISRSRRESSSRKAAITIHPSARVAPTAQLGVPYRELLEGDWERLHRPTTIGAHCDIGHFCVVGKEVSLGERTILDTYTLIAGGASVGSRVVVIHRASIRARADIGDECVIGGLIGERSKIGRACRVFGDLIHRQLDPTLPWDSAESMEGSPILEDGSFVGWGATVVGGVTIGRNAYICAGATVTRDVPAGHIVSGINELHRPEEWKGSLGKSQFFRVAAQPDG